jgi:uncharacterized membrane protein
MSDGITVSFEAIASVLGVGFMSLAGIVYRGITGKLSDQEKALKSHIDETTRELKDTNQSLQAMSVSLAHLVGRLEEEYPRGRT